MRDASHARHFIIRGAHPFVRHAYRPLTRARALHLSESLPIDYVVVYPRATLYSLGDASDRLFPNYPMDPPLPPPDTTPRQPPSPSPRPPPSPRSPPPHSPKVDDSSIAELSVVLIIVVSST